jgi:hypothetical protein
MSIGLSLPMAEEADGEGLRPDGGGLCGLTVDRREIWMRIDIDRHLVNDLEDVLGLA